MAKSIVIPIVIKEQDLAWSYELARFNAVEVFCPMCDGYHQDNTFCQMPTEGNLS